MRKYWVILWTTFFISAFYTKEISASIKNYELTDHPILNFKGPSYQISLKATKFTDYNFLDLKDVNISYIIKIDRSISKCIVHLSLQDKDGFEITSEVIGAVAEGYVGSLKGNLTLDSKDYQRISGAELFSTIVK